MVPIGAGPPPRLSTLRIGINRHGRLDPTALPACTLGQIRSSSTKYALAVCGRALVGEGRFSAKVAIPGQSSFPSRGPAGFPGASFPLARASFEFAGGPTVGSTVVRGCRARG